MGLFRYRKVREEKKVDEGIYELFRQWFRILELLRRRLRVAFVLLAFVEEHLVSQCGASSSPSPGSPKELILPSFKLVGLVYVWQNASQHSDAVQGISLRRNLWFGKGGVMPQDEQSGCYSKDQRFEILYRIISGSPNISRGEEAEDILRGLWQFPEL